MTYDPSAPTQDEREAHYNFVWPGLAASVAMVASNFLPIGHLIEGFAAVIVGSYLGILPLADRYDDYFKSLAVRAFRWAVVVIGLWTLAQGMVGILEGFYGVGVTAAGSTLPEKDASWKAPELLNSAWLLAGLASTAFHAGFAYYYLRGTE